MNQVKLLEAFSYQFTWILNRQQNCQEIETTMHKIPTQEKAQSDFKENKEW